MPLYQVFDSYLDIENLFLTLLMHNIYNNMFLIDIKKDFKILKLFFYYKHRYKRLYKDFFSLKKL